MQRLPADLDSLVNHAAGLVDPQPEITARTDTGKRDQRRSRYESRQTAFVNNQGALPVGDRLGADRHGQFRNGRTRDRRRAAEPVGASGLVKREVACNGKRTDCERRGYDRHYSHVRAGGNSQHNRCDADRERFIDGDRDRIDLDQHVKGRIHNAGYFEIRTADKLRGHARFGDQDGALDDSSVEERLRTVVALEIDVDIRQRQRDESLVAGGSLADRELTAQRLAEDFEVNVGPGGLENVRRPGGVDRHVNRARERYTGQIGRDVRVGHGRLHAGGADRQCRRSDVSGDKVGSTVAEGNAEVGRTDRHHQVDAGA